MTQHFQIVYPLSDRWVPLLACQQCSMRALRPEGTQDGEGEQKTAEEEKEKRGSGEKQSISRAVFRSDSREDKRAKRGQGEKAHGVTLLLLHAKTGCGA